eukprot:g81629.t1
MVIVGVTLGLQWKIMRVMASMSWLIGLGILKVIYPNLGGAGPDGNYIIFRLEDGRTVVIASTAFQENPWFYVLRLSVLWFIWDIMALGKKVFVETFTMQREKESFFGRIRDVIVEIEVINRFLVRLSDYRVALRRQKEEQEALKRELERQEQQEANNEAVKESEEVVGTADGYMGQYSREGDKKQDGNETADEQAAEEEEQAAEEEEVDYHPSSDASLRQRLQKMGSTDSDTLKGDHYEEANTSITAFQ